MSVGMALVDYIPVFLFLVTSVILQRDLYNKMSKGAFAVFCSGTIMVFAAGFFKATWKLLYAAGICDFYKLSEAFMPMQSTGFFLAAAGLIAMMLAKQDSKKETMMAVAAVPVQYSGTMIFVAFMCSGIAAIGIVLSVVAARMKKKGAVPLFILTIIGLLMMGYLSSKDFTNPLFNWMAEAVNVFAQGAFLWGTMILHKAGLADFRLKKA